MHWLRPPAVATFNHGDAIAAAVAAGVGIGQTLEMLVVPEITERRLVPSSPSETATAYQFSWSCRRIVLRDQQ